MSDKPLLCVDYTPTRIFRNLDIPVSTIKEIRTRGDAGALDLMGCEVPGDQFLRQVWRGS